MRRDLVTDFFTLPTPRLFAHRGAGGEFPENTMLSFEAAARAGAKHFELDVHMTRDGEIVVSHDGDLGRAAGIERAIAAMTLREVQNADAGYNFTPDGGATFPFRGRGAVIPRLADVLAAFPEMRVIIEVKQQTPSLVAPMLSVIERAGMRRRVLIASEHQQPIDEIRALAPELPTNFPYGEVAEFLQAMAARRDDYVARADALQIPPAYEGWKLVTPESIAFAHRCGVEVHVWTVNDESEMHELLDLGVDGILTDFPARGLAVIESRGRARS